MKDAEVIERLKEICTDADPTKLYRSLVKIGQGCAFRLISTTFVLSRIGCVQCLRRGLYSISSRHQSICRYQANEAGRPA